MLTTLLVTKSFVPDNYINLLAVLIFIYLFSFLYFIIVLAFTCLLYHTDWFTCTSVYGMLVSET